MANQTSAIGISTTGIISTFDILKPEVRNRLFRSKGDQGMGAMRLLESLGYSRSISQDSAISYEEDWIHPTFHSDGIVGAAAAGTAIAPPTQTIRVSNNTGNNDYLTFAIVDDGSAAPTSWSYCPVQQWDLIMYPTGEVAQVTALASVGTDTVDLTVVSSDFSVGLPALVANEELIIYSNAFPEGSDQPDGIQNKPKKTTAYVQIIKTGFRWTGTQATNRSWFDTYKGAGDIPAYYLKGQMDTEYEHELKIDGALLFGKLTTSNIIDNSGFSASSYEPIKTTEGQIPYMRANGNLKQYTPGTFAIQTMNDIVKLLDKQFTPRYIMGMVGINLDIEIEDTLKAYFQNTNITYVTENMVKDCFGGNAALAASVGFNVLTKGDYTFCFSRMPIFSHARLYGASGFKTPSLGAFIPMGTKRDLKSDYDVPYFGMIYKALGDYSRKAEVWTLQGAAPGTKVFSKDINQLCMRSHIGAEHVGANQTVLLDPQ